MSSGRRTLRFANSVVAIEHHGPRAERLVASLFRHVPEDAAGLPPHRTIRVADDATTRSLVLSHDGKPPSLTTDCLGRFAEALQGEATYHLADAATGGMLFHAAAVGRHGRAVIVPGVSGTGKSTFSAFLLTRGYAYLTDELVFVPEGGTRVEGLCRPLNLKRPVRPVLEALLSGDGEGRLSHAGGDLVPAECFGALPQKTASAGAILFVRFDAAVESTLTVLGGAEAARMLIESLINARNLDGHGFREVTRLAREVPAFSLSYGRFDQLGDTLRRLSDVLAG